MSPGAPNQIVLLNLESRQETRLIPNGSNARYASSGHLLYVADGSLRALPFDLARLETLGEPVPVLDDVATKGVGAGQFAVSETGTLFYLHGKVGTSDRTLVWVGRDGHEELTGIPSKLYSVARLSPDGTRVAVDVRGLSNDIWTWDLGRRILAPFAIGPGEDIYPLWSQDGRRIAFSGGRDGTQNIYWQNADGTGTADRLTEGGRPQNPLAFTPDSKGLLLHEPGASPYDLGFADLTNHKPSELILHASYNESNGAF